MSAVKTIDLGEHFGAFVEAQVEAGNFADADAVIRAGLSLLERRDAEDEARIRAAIEEGFASGEPVAFDRDEFLRRMHDLVGSKAQ
ncbi:type II toxin-antitoxin system ParD family antitoxin [Jiella avicenniae]|uniref:Type II toxin-antitoxin system ParD family antitoxin n=1 Tax=Jiella avicenniae TaxID=2907202 RepID=A0A9X1P4H6_9HYPH|nr:type II toxin-antitoxin system ParD family antitoxin [Jiella avicenniae]MCE7029699.1 type II toxin-antitoxin system ParD family antitoxin [Jiella avicenniae]